MPLHCHRSQVHSGAGVVAPDRVLLYFDLRPGPKMLFQGDTPEGSDAFQWPVIERDRVGGLRLMI